MLLTIFLHLIHLTPCVTQAVQIQKEELYAEPSYFYQPAQHCLGAVLLQQGKTEEASALYEEDLKALPSNVWSQVGSSQSRVQLQGKTQGVDSALSEVSDPRQATSCPAFF